MNLNLPAGQVLPFSAVSHDVAFRIAIHCLAYVWSSEPRNPQPPVDFNYLTVASGHGVIKLRQIGRHALADGVMLIAEPCYRDHDHEAEDFLLEDAHPVVAFNNDLVDAEAAGEDRGAPAWKDGRGH